MRRRLEGDDRRSEESDDLQGLFEILSFRGLERSRSRSGYGADDDGAGKTDGDFDQTDGTRFDDGRGKRPSSGRRDWPVQGRHLHHVEDALRLVLAPWRRGEVVLSVDAPGVVPGAHPPH